MSSSTLTPTRSGESPEPSRRPTPAKPAPTPKALVKSARNATSTASRGEYRPDIDGIRGVAAVMVMGFHAEVPGFEGAYIGLDLFFVVSGFVIAGLLMHEHGATGTIRWGAFYARRARRLIPAKAVMLVGVLVLSYFILTPTSVGGEGAQQQTARSAAAAAGFVSNFFFLGESSAGDVDYFSHQPGTGVLLHTWSLSVEEQFYLALPLAILLAWLISRLLNIPVLRSLLITTVVLGVASLLLAVFLAGRDPDAAYYLPVTRAFEFLIGVGLALVARTVRPAQDVREVMGLAGVVIIALVIWQPLPVDGYPSYWALLPCAAAALLVWAGVGGPTVVTRLLSFRVLVGLGLISYGWYLWHWPFLVLGESVNLAPPPLPARIGLVLLALGVAWLSYRYIEGLFYKRSGTVTKSRTWGSRRVMVSGVLAMSGVAGLSGGALALADEARTSRHWESVSAQLTDAPVMPAACLREDDIIPDRPGRCDLVPFERGRPTVMLWGDSHAWMYIPAIEAAARGKDVNLVAFVMGACPVFIPTDTAVGSCARSNAKAMRFTEALVDDRAPLKVIISQSYETYRGTPAIGDAERDVDYVDKLARYSQLGTPALFERLSDIGADVDVVGPTPIFPRNAPLCEAKLRPFTCDVPRSEAIVDEDQNRAWLMDLMGGLPGAADAAGSRPRIVVTTADGGQGTPDPTAGGDGGARVEGGAAPPRFIDPTAALCDATTCFAEADGLSYYFDDNHLSAKMSRTLATYFAPSVRDVLVGAPTT